MLCLDVILFIGYVILWVTLVDVDVTSVRVCGGGKCPMSVICFLLKLVLNILVKCWCWCCFIV